MMTYNILYQFNDKYAPFAGVSITSLFENNKALEDICVWVLGEELSEESIRRFDQLAELYERKIRFVQTQKLVEQMKELKMPTYRGSYAANMRLFLPEVLPTNVERVLYLDADTIVDGSIAKLYSKDLRGKSLGMVYDSLGEMHKKEIGLSKDDGYYNSGVILFDMDSWRNKRLSERIVLHVQNVRSNYPSPDQDLINVVCKDEIVTISPRYNLQPVHVVFSEKQYYFHYARSRYYSKKAIERAKRRPVIYHFFRFVGEFPWNQGNVHPDGHLFDGYLEKSLWNDYEKEKAELSFIMRIEKWLYRHIPKMCFLAIFKMAHRLFYIKADRMSGKGSISKTM